MIRNESKTTRIFRSLLKSTGATKASAKHINMLKAFRYRIYPNEKYQVIQEEYLWARRFAFNYGLKKNIEYYQQILLYHTPISGLKQHKNEHPGRDNAISQPVFKNLDNI